MRVKQETPEFLKDIFASPQSGKNLTGNEAKKNLAKKALRKNLANGPLQPALAKAQYILDRLPEGSVVLDRLGDAWQVSWEYWYRSYGDSSEVSSFELAQRAPIKVIHMSGSDDA